MTSMWKSSQQILLIFLHHILNRQVTVAYWSCLWSCLIQILPVQPTGANKMSLLGVSWICLGGFNLKECAWKCSKGRYPSGFLIRFMNHLSCLHLMMRSRSAPSPPSRWQSVCTRSFRLNLADKQKLISTTHTWDPIVSVLIHCSEGIDHRRTKE